MSTETLRRCVELAGGQVSLAKAIGATQQHIWNWLNRDKQVPADRVLPIVSAVRGQVRPYDLRPDIYPDPDWMPPASDQVGSTECA